MAKNENLPVVPGQPSVALSVFEPNSYTELKELCVFLGTDSKCDAVPNDYIGKPGSMLAAAMLGRSIGLGFMQSLQNVAVINGRPSVWGDAMLAVVINTGELESFTEMDFPDIIKNKQAVCQLKRRGRPIITRTFTEEMAKVAGLLNKGGAWKTNPARQYQMRARAFALRDAFPDVLKGIYAAEESFDIETTGRVIEEGGGSGGSGGTGGLPPMPETGSGTPPPPSGNPEETINPTEVTAVWATFRKKHSREDDKMRAALNWIQPGCTSTKDLLRKHLPDLLALLAQDLEIDKEATPPLLTKVGGDLVKGPYSAQPKPQAAPEPEPESGGAVWES